MCIYFEVSIKYKSAGGWGNQTYLKLVVGVLSIDGWVVISKSSVNAFSFSNVVHQIWDFCWLIYM